MKMIQISRMRAIRENQKVPLREGRRFREREFCIENLLVRIHVMIE